MNYQLVDSGNGKKLELFDQVLVERPSPYALWKPTYPEKWEKNALIFNRDQGWNKKKSPWKFSLEDVSILLEPTDFGHLGIFPEHQALWDFCPLKPSQKVLHLFAHTGAFSIKAAKLGVSVTHVDSSKPANQWAKKNAQLNDISSIRWITEDALKFLKKEEKRNKKYDGIIMDPPTFGRGAKGELFQIEKHLQPLLKTAFPLLDPKKAFLLFSCHTPGFTPLVVEQILRQYGKGSFETKELFLGKSSENQIPAGVACLYKTF